MTSDEERDDEGNLAPREPPTTDGQCASCHEREGEWRIDPYNADVDNRREWVFICDRCFEAHADDI